MTEPKFDIREPTRLEGRTLRSVRLIAALAAAALPVVALTPGCGGGDPDPDSPGGTSGTGGFQIDIELPPDIESRLIDLATELGAAICERGRTCCDHYGFKPRTDCMQLGGEIFALQVIGATEFGTTDTSELDFAIDEAMAARCVQVARSVANQCVFSPDAFMVEWFWTCAAVLSITPKGEAPRECEGDLLCEAKYGPGHGCVAARCLPHVEVGEGEACGSANGGSTIPVCAASHQCRLGTCQSFGAIGEPCPTPNGCVPEAYCDSTNDAYLCVARLPLGAPCQSDICAEGLHCACPDLNCQEQRVCLERRGIGEPCSVDGECSFPVLCQDGICKPSSIGFCAPP